MTRLVDRIAKAGLLRREPTPEDRRGAMAVITEAGLDAVEHAWPHYANGISQYFAHNLSTSEIRALTSALAKVRDQVTDPS